MAFRSFSALSLLCFFCLTSAQAAVVENARTWRSPEYTRLVFDLNSTIEYTISTLANPDRVVIDLLDTQVIADFTNLDLSNTSIASINSSVLNKQDMQVVLQMRSKVDPRSFALGENEQYGNRLVIDLYDSKEEPKSAAPVVITSVNDIDLAKRDIVVAISAGHGGDDPGAIGISRLQEKHVVLAIAKEVQSRINSTPGYKAVMIRDGDYYVGLRTQIEIAHKHNADLFIAIHADAAERASANGATIYALSHNGATSEQASRLAQMENSTDLIGGVGSVSLVDKDEVLASVLLDMSMTASVATSLEIGNSLIASLGQTTKMRRTTVEQAAFVVLKSADIPSLLIESGYITNDADAKNLDSPRWRQKFADAVVEGITHWFYQRPPRGSLIAWQQANPQQPRLDVSYTVKRGDSLSELADQFGVTMTSLKFANEMDTSSIQVGQILTIPGTTLEIAAVFTEHTITRGETLSQIALTYSVTMASIRASNQLKSDTIRIGQVLKIPTS